MMNMTMSTGFNGDKAILPGGAACDAGGGMVIRMGGPGGAIAARCAESRRPSSMAQMNKATLRSSRAGRLAPDARLVRHGASRRCSAQYTYAGEAESPDGKAYVIDVKDADGFAARLFIDQNSTCR